MSCEGSRVNPSCLFFVPIHAEPVQSVKQPTPAIVAQSAVQRLPRLALWVLCLAYALPGFLARDPWKRADLTTYGYIHELTTAGANWWQPTLAGLAPEIEGPLPYWLGAWAINALPAGLLPSEVAARLPFIGLLLLTLLAVWYGCYYLARSPMAQPVAFAFGGEAKPVDYARALADGGLLAFIACLGLAQLAHETTPALLQLCCTSLVFYAAAALPFRWWLPGLAALAGLGGLTLSGAPTMALLLGLGCAVIDWFATRGSQRTRLQTFIKPGLWLLASAVLALLAREWGLWQWRIELPRAEWKQWQSLGRLFLWFTWPAWPLALWTLWRWRRQIWSQAPLSRHLWLPIWFYLVAGAATLSTSAADRSLLLGLPALAMLAALALPTLSRSVAALIDWLTLIFFSGCAIVIWVVWLSMHAGWPAQPARNVAKLAPGFLPEFSVLTFLIAVSASLTWAWLVFWRTGKHRRPIWKSLVLPAGGASLCWVLLMTLWLPMLDYARSYAPMVRLGLQQMAAGPTGCVATQGLHRSQLAALRVHGQLDLVPLQTQTECPWLIADGRLMQSPATELKGWTLHATLRHPADRDEKLLLLRRTPPQ